MLLSQCPNCQHDNPPGERFCAACGVPLDLKPCPVCGKVDSIKATVCSGCGAHFPPLPGALSGEAVNASERPLHVKQAPSVITPPTTTMRALPLIVVALAAGGIPLLWLYRNTMPVPKAWQAPTGSQVAAPVPTPPVRLEPVPPPQPPKAAPAPAVEEAAPPAPAPKPVVKAGTAHAAPKTAAKAPEKASGDPSAAQATKAAQGAECTEALAAVGLCDPKAGK